MNVSDKYFWIIKHKKIGVPYTQGIIKLTPQMVDPIKREINLEDSSKNIKLEWWVEFSKLDSVDDDIVTHYWDLDCGGDTAEEAIEKLYNLVKEKYGDY